MTERKYEKDFQAVWKQKMSGNDTLRGNMSEKVESKHIGKEHLDCYQVSLAIH